MLDDHVLRDGSVVTLRRVEPADAAALHALYDDLERDDIRLRFFSPTANTDRVLLQLLDPPNVNVVAMAGRRLVAHGMYAPLGGDRAEVAFTVAHERRARGSAPCSCSASRASRAPTGSRRSSRTCSRTTTA